MNPVRSLVTALPLALALFVGGCSADAESNEADTSEAEMNEATPITLANYVSHPTIKAIRAEVLKIDGMPLTSTERPDCDGSATKYESDGKVRKVKIEGGEGGFEGVQNAYFRENGKLLFIIGIETDHTGEAPVRTERRIYVDDAAKIIFQVNRGADGKDFVPEGTDAFRIDDFETWQPWYESTSCGGGECARSGH